MDLLSFPTTTLAVGSYAIAFVLTSTTIFLAVHQYSRTQTTHSHGFHTNLPYVKTIRLPSEPLALPELYQSAKAILLLQRGADVWLPYMIPLYSETTKLGSKLSTPPAESDVGFELLSSLSIDEEHCMIQTQHDTFVIFDRARFNHTLVNQMPVPPAGMRLFTGAVITLGSVEYLFVGNRGR